jgi:hypothetical protein
MGTALGHHLRSCSGIGEMEKHLKAESPAADKGSSEQVRVFNGV